ncbi:MAG: hypothetical protein DRJ65_00075 [Acidobacteria bacterium]|nr:MAG: hypothetical protein DRJ65_00075 [Acidobacteriota bacterium]
MAFTVETGAGVAGANSYLSVADADTYHTDRANSGWTGADAVKQAALIEATDYLEAHYQWSTGYKTSDDQGLSWPRSGAIDRHGWAIDSDEVPQEVKGATAYLALQGLSAALGGPLGREQKKVKVASVEVEYTDTAAATTTYPYVDGLLTGLVTNSSSSVEVFLT